MHRDFRDTHACKIISVIILFFFCWSFAGVRDIAWAAANPGVFKSNSRPAHSARKMGPAALHSAAIKSLKDALEPEHPEKLSHKDKKARVKSLRLEIKAQEDALRTEFKSTRARLVEKGLSASILKRHDDFIAGFDDKSAKLEKHLKAMVRAFTRAGFNSKAKDALAFIRRHEPPSRHVPLDPTRLPHRAAEPTKLKPRTSAEEFKNLRAEGGSWTPIYPEPILVASSGSLAGLLAGSLELAAGDPPTDADLAETVEVQFTPAINAKAAELGNDPRVIYEWVRNNVEFVPTYGSIQGADYCLQTMECNAFDTASLLTALLRTSGIHARYAMGTVQTPVAKFTNWVGGFTNSIAAIDFAASGGIPTTGLVEAGKIRAVRFEHVWVEAWVDMIPSMGAIHRAGDTWVPLDASFKQYTYTEGMDLSAEVPFDAETLVEDIVASAIINVTDGSVTGMDSSIINTAMTEYRAQVEEYMSTQAPDATVGDVLGMKTINQSTHAILMGTLPYKLLVTGARYAEIMDSDRHKLSFSVTGGDMYYNATPLNASYSMPEIAGKKITLSYSPASQADEDVINSYLPTPHPDGTPIDPSELPSSLPAYLINLKPELRVDGVVVATGGAVQMGTAEKFNMTFHDPAHSDDIIRNTINAGEYFGIAVDVGRISQGMMEDVKTRMEATKAKLEAEDFTGLTKDELLGDLLYTTAMTYFAELDAFDFIQSRTMGLIDLRFPSEAIFKTSLNVGESFGIPVSAGVGGLAMDADRIMSLTKSRDGDNAKKLQFMQMSGMNSSALEHSVPEQLFSTPENPVEAVSAVKAIQIAAAQGIPIYTVTAENAATVIPLLELDAAVINEIRNAVNSGNTVTVSKTEINFNGWIGAGYIIIDPTTGASAYMISGGESGSKVIEHFLWTLGIPSLACHGEIEGTGCIGGIVAGLAIGLYTAIEAVVHAMRFWVDVASYWMEGAHYFYGESWLNMFCNSANIGAWSIVATLSVYYFALYEFSATISSSIVFTYLSSDVVLNLAILNPIAALIDGEYLDCAGAIYGN